MPIVAQLIRPFPNGGGKVVDRAQHEVGQQDGDCQPVPVTAKPEESPGFLHLMDEVKPALTERLASASMNSLPTMLAAQAASVT